MPDYGSGFIRLTWVRTKRIVAELQMVSFWFSLIKLLPLAFLSLPCCNPTAVAGQMAYRWPARRAVGVSASRTLSLSVVYAHLIMVIIMVIVLGLND